MKILVHLTDNMSISHNTHEFDTQGTCYLDIENDQLTNHMKASQHQEG